jgi:catechol 2,3-dioxygenase-like lactoylglutathione lyase family enzyme
MRLLEMHIETANVESSLEFYRKIIPHQKVIYFPDGNAAALVLADGTAFGIWKSGRRGLYNSQAGKHVHFAFEIRPDEYGPLKEKLLSLGVEIIEHDWKDGHRSLYFFDPDHHQVEFMTKDWLGRDA